MLLPSIFREKRLKAIAGLKASSQNSTTCLSMGQPASCAVAVLEGNTGRARLSEAEHRHDTHRASAACACKGARAGYS